MYAPAVCVQVKFKEHYNLLVNQALDIYLRLFALNDLNFLRAK